MHVIAAKAVAFKEALQKEFKVYQRRILDNSGRLASELMALGYRLVSGGTDNHLMLVDLTPRGLTGKTAEEALDEAGITANKNSIPFDPLKPQITSGIRIGTPALTTRGMEPDDMKQVAQFIHRALQSVGDHDGLRMLRAEVAEFCCAFPSYR